MSLSADEMQCDEKRPVCDKCAIHYSNISKCDYGDSSESLELPLKKSAATERSRRTSKSAVPLLPKTVQQADHVGPLAFRPASAYFDPFTTYPPTAEPDVNLLMGACGYSPPWKEAPLTIWADFDAQIWNLYPYVITPPAFAKIFFASYAPGEVAY
jgi:hypothetical protein